MNSKVYKYSQNTSTYRVQMCALLFSEMLSPEKITALFSAPLIRCCASANHTASTFNKNADRGHLRFPGCDVSYSFKRPPGESKNRPIVPLQMERGRDKERQKERVMVGWMDGNLRPVFVQSQTIQQPHPLRNSCCKNVSC